MHRLGHVADETDWHGILALYDQFQAIAPGPIMTLNRAVAVAVAEVDGPEEACRARRPRPRHLPPVLRHPDRPVATT